MENLAQNLHATVRCVQQFISEVNNMGLINCNDLIISCCSEISGTVASSYLMCMKEFINKLKAILDGAPHVHMQDSSPQDNSKRDLEGTSIGNPDMFLNMGNICANVANNQNFEVTSMTLIEDGKINSVNFGENEKLDDTLRSYQTVEPSTVESLNSYHGSLVNSQTNTEFSHTSDVLYSLSNLSIGSDKHASESRDSNLQPMNSEQEAPYHPDNETICEDINQTASVGHQSGPTEIKAHGKINDMHDEAEAESNLCTKCGLHSYVLRQIGRNKNICSCSNPTKSRESKKRHLSSITQHPCDKCNRVFRKWKHLSYHYHKVHRDGDTNDLAFVLSPNEPQTEHDLPIFCCKTCNVACSNLHGFQSHICRLSDEEESDTLTSINNKILITNVLKLHQMRKFICNICCIEYRTFKRIAYHLPRCSPGPYSCNGCSELFKSQRELNYHKRKNHKGEKCFTCDECGKGFLRAASLRKHSINRHESRTSDGGGSFVSYKCDLCPKTFIKKIYLTNHKLRMHGLDKKFLCQICGKRFMSKNSLAVHMEAHKETKRFECKFCQRRFRKKEKMQHHERIHTGERPFQCDNCSKAFISKGRLTEHQRRHKGEKRYCCPLCSKSYAAAWDLKKHTRKFHNKELESVPVKVIPSRDNSNMDDQQQSKTSEQETVAAQPHLITLTSTVGTLTIPIVHRVQGCQVSHLGHVVQLTGGPVLGHAINASDAPLHTLQTVQTIPTIQPAEYSVHTLQAAQGSQVLQPISTLQALPNLSQAEYPVHTIQTSLPTNLYSSNTS